MPAPQKIVELVDQFERNLSSYKADTYKEAHLRHDFLDKFFGELGWDVNNDRGHSEIYKEVVHEDTLRIGRFVNAPDYSFKIGGTRKFFVEAKKPSAGISDGGDHAYQLRRYAWSAKLSLSILTDFEEFAVYDSRIRPAIGDKASVARILYFTYKDYLTRWDEISGIFSRESVLKGSFDSFADKAKQKKGTTEVDVTFLDEIEAWRESLAHNVALRNPRLTVEELNFAVQATLDRIIFLRICEDRGVEDYGQLKRLIDTPNIYTGLKARFERADERYNSGLFHFQAEHGRPSSTDTITLKLKIDDAALKPIIKNLYYPDCPFEFSVIPPEILGQVYEQFLGKVIVKTESGRAQVKDRPEVKKAGGVYYTPANIVAQVVTDCLEKALKDKTVRQAANVTVVDPSCGSGSFLIAAYQYLLDWHLKAYLSEGDPEKNSKLYRTASKEWRLTSQERKRILINSIHGVDVDPQAVEVAKLSLLLKVLEGETEQTILAQYELFHERALPDLDSNIKCGNSLLEHDFIHGDQIDLLTAGPSMVRDAAAVNAFNWRQEFKEIFQSKGFSAVIGNPPWGQKEIDKDERLKDYIRKKYPSAAGIFDLYRPFVERSIDLVKPGGQFGMVLPDIVLLKDYQETRDFILNTLQINSIHWWGMAFKNAVIDAVTIVGTKAAATNSQRVSISIHEDDHLQSHTIPQADFAENPRHTFNLMLTPEKREIVKRLAKCPRLSDYFEIHEGVHSGNIRSELFVDKRLDSTCKELLFGRGEIAPYNLKWEGGYIRLSAVPKKRTTSRYANIGQASWHEQKKILVRRTGDYVLAAVDEEGRYASNNFFLVLPIKTHALNLDGTCALLNSPFMTWFFQTVEPRRGRVFAEIKIKHLTMFPMPALGADKESVAALNILGRTRAEVARTLRHAQLPTEITAAQRYADELDLEINTTVCKLFDLDERLISRADAEENAYASV